MPENKTCKECADFERCEMWNYSFDSCPWFKDGGKKMETEKRLIDAKFAQHIADVELTPDNAGIVQWVLSHTPTVDAVEVVHGRWIWNEENECWVCSNCKMSALNNYRGNSTNSNYCPNCGAAMKGVTL